jgi:hypothetical protein
MGIDITKNIKTGKTDYETYQLNVENDACIGGPKSRYDCKKSTILLAHLQTLVLQMAY